MTKKLEGKIAVVSGASRGIGFAIAKELAGAGAHIIAIARTSGGLEELDDEIKSLGSTATLVPLDVQDYEAIDRLGAAIYERWGKLDILVGNAGVLGTLGPIGHTKPKVWDEAFAVNVTANWRMIRSFDPLLKQAENARAVFVTSGAAYKCKAYWGAYSATKAALEAMVKTWAAENQTTGLNINMINPGPVATKMRAEAMPGENPKTLPTPDELAVAMMPLFLQSMEDSGQIFDFENGEVHLRNF